MSLPKPSNEPILDYAPGSPERTELRSAIGELQATARELPCVIGGERTMGKSRRDVSCPADHQLQLGTVGEAGEAEVEAAIAAAQAARPAWQDLPQTARGEIFLRAAELLAGPWRQRLNAATLLNQSKTPHQAEIDSACELIDFLRFNAYYAEHLADDQPASSPGVYNRLEMRPLDGFIYAVSPFNFTAIAGNLPTAPAMVGNTVVWKPSPNAALSGALILELLETAGLPPGVINLVHGDAATITDQVLSDAAFAGLHFTGSTAVFQGLYAKIGGRIANYRCYPRIVGESGGKDFIVAHPSADPAAVATAIVRGGFEFQGQKCSAASRAYVPASLWPEIRDRAVADTKQLKVGDPRDFSMFMGAVISEAAFDRIRGYQQLAAKDTTVLAGGGGDKSTGYFVEPTLVEVSDAGHRLMREEVFGPLVTCFVYDDAAYADTLDLCDRTSPYALTGAVFARDRAAIAEAHRRLRFAAGNFYINDKPTGAVVGQQPFGGSRMSGTNDKAGSALNLLRWTSPRTVKETFVSSTAYGYPYMASE